MNGLEDSISSRAVGERSAFLEFVGSGSREALDRVVREYLDFVYATARRQVGDPHLAEDVTQAVFIVLARRGRSIRSESGLAGWLFRTTRYAAANAIKMEQRRRGHERAAASERREEAMPESSSGMSKLLPLLDEAIGKLGRADRDAILLRFLQNREMTEIGKLLGVSEAAARKRVGRAVERLRSIFLKRGVNIESGMLTTSLMAAASEAAPAGVVTSVSSAVGGMAPLAATSIAQGVHAMFLVARAKIIGMLLIASVALVTATTVAVHRSIEQAATEAPRPEPPAVLPAVRTDQKTVVDVTCVDAQGKPIEGAEVYLGQSILARTEANTLLGPVTANPSGVARFSGVPVIQAGDRTCRRVGYARVAGKFIGFDSQYWEKGQARTMSSSMKIALVPSITIHGRVVVPLGFMAKTAHVSLDSIILGFQGPMFWRNGSLMENLLPSIYDVSVNAVGTFAMSDLPAQGMSYLFVNAPGLAESQPRLDAGNSTPVVNMKVQSLVRGRVTMPDGKPAANVVVEAHPSGAELMSNHSFDGKTDADGRYAIERLPGVYVRLTASTGDLVMPIQSIRLASGETVTKDLTLQTGTLVSGWVGDIQGNALADADVGVDSLTEPDVRIGAAETDRMGRYSLRLPAGGAKFYISRPPGGFDYSTKNRDVTVTIPVGAETVAGPMWKLPPAKPEEPDTTASLAGRVVDTHGKGIAHLWMRDATVEGRNDSIQVYPSVAETDDDGRYRCVVVAGVTHTLSPDSPDFDWPKTRTVIPTVDQAIEFADLVVHARPVLGTISGIVIDPSGRPLEDVSIDAADRSRVVTTDVSGRFSIATRSSPQQLIVSKAGYRYRNWNDLPPGAVDVRLTLYPKSEKAEDYGARTELPDPKSLVNGVAPAFHVDWVFTPLGHAPSPGNSGGKMMVIAFTWEQGDAKGSQGFVSELIKICDEGDAVPVVIYRPQSTEVGVRAVFSDHSPAANIGIDQYWADGYPNDPDAKTEMAYGAVKWPAIYVVSADGTVVHTQKGLKGLERNLSP